MATNSYTAADVMDKSAALMNDAAKTSYTYAAMLPYLNMALDELQESFQQNNIPIYNATAATITIPIGTTTINAADAAGPGGGAAPNLPADLVEIQGLYERLAGSSDPFIPMTQREFLPHALDNLPTEALQFWIYDGQRIQFIGALTAREVKIDYLKAIITSDVTQTTVIGIIDAKTFLYYRTAALCSQFIGENKTRADDLNGFAVLALDRVTSIGVKGKQSIQTRRRPFMGAYKRRSFT
jgi:hypothetical protein